jgi:hypothetical protein
MKRVVMNITIQSLLIMVGMLVCVETQAYIYRFNNHTREELVIQMQLRGISEPDEEFMVPSLGTGERSIGGLRIGLCTEYVRVRKMNGEMVSPRLLQASPGKYERLKSKIREGKSIDLDDMRGSDLMITPVEGRCGDMVLDIISDSNGTLFFVMINPLLGGLLQ